MNWINRIFRDAKEAASKGKNVRTFATLLSGILLLISFWNYFTHNTLELPVTLIAIALFIYYSKCTRYFRLFYTVWMFISKLIGDVISSTLLTLLYLIIIVPLGFIKSLFSKKKDDGWQLSDENDAIDFDKLY